MLDKKTFNKILNRSEVMLREAVESSWNIKKFSSNLEEDIEDAFESRYSYYAWNRPFIKFTTLGYPPSLEEIKSFASAAGFNSEASFFRGNDWKKIVNRKTKDDCVIFLKDNRPFAMLMVDFVQEFKDMAEGYKTKMNNTLNLGKLVSSV